MIAIKKENDIRNVTKGSYNNFYKNLGYEIVDDKKVETKKEEVKITEQVKENKKEDSVLKSEKRK